MDVRESNEQPAEEAAASWLMRLDRGLTDEEGQRFLEWLRESPHREALAAAARLWPNADVVTVLAGLVPDELRRAERKPVRARIGRGIVAASALIAVMLAALGGLSWSHLRSVLTSPVPKWIYTTARDEVRELPLSDGSRVTLNANTKLIVLYSRNGRDVYIPSGEASFRVASEARPFNVHASRCWLHVFGTQFDVRVISPESTDVTVEQGPVQVSCDGSNLTRTAYFARLQANEAHEPTMVNASEGLLFESGLQFVHRIQPAEMEQRLSWQHKALRTGPE